MVAEAITTSTTRIRVKRLAGVIVTAAALGIAFTLVDIGEVAQAASRLSLATLLGVVLALLCGALLASVRLVCVAADLGYRMRPIDAIAALSFGQLGGALFFQLVGQLIARSAVLACRGVPVAGTVAITGYERLVALVVSLTVAVIGGWYLFGKITLDVSSGGATFLKLAAGGAIAIAASAFLAWGRPACAFVRANMGPGAVWRFGRSAALSLGIQGCTMAAYVAAVASLSPNTDATDAAAAVAVVMLAASLPISFAGWGIRELGAIYALGAIGLDRESALVVAILIGAAALGVVAILAGITALARAAPRASVPSAKPPRFDLPLLLAWAVPVMAAIAVFFQIHAPLSASRLNVNLADPIAILAAALFVLDHIRARQIPAWRLPLLNAHLAVMTGVIVIAFLHGWADFGVTTWALTNRLAGWFVLLAYVAAGALIVSRGGEAGLMMLLRTYVAVALAIVALDALIFAAVSIGVRVPEEIVRYRIDGFAQNPNAFALQLLLAIAAVIATMKESRWQPAVLAVLMLGLWLTASRAGFIGLALVILATLVLRSVKAKRIAAAFGLSAIAIAFVIWLPTLFVAALEVARWIITGALWVINGALWVASAAVDLVTTREAGAPGTGSAVIWAAPALTWEVPHYTANDYVTSGYAPSNEQRIASLQGGADLFMANPLFGAGLGAFIESYTRVHGSPLVIHSTPLWLLAELGIVGLVAFVAPFIRVLKYETYSASLKDPARTFLILALLAFAAVAAVHDMMYQRAFWLLLGAGLATYGGSRQTDASEARRSGVPCS